MIFPFFHIVTIKKTQIYGTVTSMMVMLYVLTNKNTTTIQRVSRVN